MPPPGYQPAPKTGSFTAIAATPSSSTWSSDASILPGTISTELVGPFSSQQYVTQDGWWDEASGTVYDVYSGYEASSPQQGVVVVYSAPSNEAEQSGTLSAYPTAGQDGSVQMTSSDGWTIALTAADGVTYHFDVADGSYAAS
ncbi:MAG: hypothetical protein ACRD0Z_10875 [Acidimicrobiales bacterium]